MKHKIMKKYIVIPASLLLAGFLSLALTKTDVYKEVAQSIKLLNNAYKYIITYYADEVNVDEFTRSVLRSMSSELDPYTIYLEAEERHGIDLLKTGKYGGVGIQIGKREGKLTVIAPMDDSPAKRAGIMSGDVISKIDSTFTQDLDINDAAKMIRGEKKTQVILTIDRESEDSAIEFALIREDIRVKDVAYSGMIDGGIGYIRLTRFSKNSSGELQYALENLLSENADGLILDLRDNPGGLLQSAIEILDMFIPKGDTLLSTRGKVRESNRIYTSRHKPIVPEEVNLAILINGGSASASEIVAGAIQDLDRGIVVGKRSFGKGLVQSVYRLGKDRSLKITTAKYYIPSGRLIQKPDYVDEDLIIAPTDEDSLFTTVGGRKVAGGGGITPDIDVDIKPSGPLLRECWRNGWFFSFIQREKNRYSTFEDVQADVALMERFQTFLDTMDVNVQLSGERLYDDAKEKLTALDSTNTNLEIAFAQIDAFIYDEESSLFEREKEDLEHRLMIEFADHFSGATGRFNVSLKKDEAVLRAIELLKNSEKYTGIFSGK
ncbi:MAG: PDZ domain-containing protein [Candidatus Marinimicrobia bacterium]|nr:PDZ domain-containing protein [Candidatus Neomarinimicrobiota bacterium]